MPYSTFGGMLSGSFKLKRTVTKFPIRTCRDTCRGAPIYLYDFDKENPSRTRIEKTKDFEEKDYFKIRSGPKATIFARIHKNTQTARGAGSKGLLRLAKHVHRDFILPKTVDTYVQDDNVNVFGKYVSVSMVNSRLSEYDTIKAREKDRIMKLLFRESHLIGEKRQLTEILIKSLQTVLPSHFVVGNYSLLHSAGIDKGVNLCEFATSQPDIIITHSDSGGHPMKRAVVSVDVNRIDNFEDENDLYDNVLGFTIEAKRDEFKVEQTIANMIKVATDLSIIAIKNGDYIQNVTVYGVAASYYNMEGKIVKLEMNFEKGGCIIQYVTEPLGLSFCINAVCTTMLNCIVM